MMTEEKKFNLKDYNKLQIEEIERYRVRESEKAGKELGEECVLKWIKDHSADFRRRYLETFKYSN